MTEILICEKCGKEGVPFEFIVIKRKRLKNILLCKDCNNTKNMNKHEKAKYFKKREYILRRKIRRMYNTGIVRYSTYAKQLTLDDCAVRHPDGRLFVKCAYCGQLFSPTIRDVRNRIKGINNIGGGENRLYCSKHCKNACPVFNQKKWPKGYKKGTSREVQPQLRQMRLEIDNYQCQRCGVSIKNAELHCHHITGVMQNPIESADVDNTITLCKKCHSFVHSLPGCHYSDFRCKGVPGR